MLSHRLPLLHNTRQYSGVSGSGFHCNVYSSMRVANVTLSHTEHFLAPFMAKVVISDGELYSHSRGDLDAELRIHIDAACAHIHSPFFTK